MRIGTGMLGPKRGEMVLKGRSAFSVKRKGIFWNFGLFFRVTLVWKYESNEADVFLHSLKDNKDVEFPPR